MNVPAVRDALRTRGLPPYEQLEEWPTRADETLRVALDGVLADGWEHDGHRLDLTPPVAWTHPNRSFEFRLHSWDPMAPLLLGHAGLRDQRYLEAALALALDWVRAHQKQLLSLDREAALDLAATQTDTAAWYDMAVGLRVYRLAYLADVVGRGDDVDDDTVALLLDTLRFHLDLLARDPFWVSHNNHGLYQALGQAAAARRFAFIDGFDRHATQAAERLETMLERSFFPSGVHREHSPGYHQMVLGSLVGARTAGLLSPHMDDMLEKAEEALAWMIGPHGVLATIGDTDYRAGTHPSASLDRYHHPAVVHLMSNGRAGSPPPQGIRYYEDAGMAFVRSRDTYLAQISGFHSRTHKHADHFSFVWWDRGEEVLIDPGRFGYLGKTKPGTEEFDKGFWYSDPRRQYVERTRAHNCVEIDGQDYLRKRTTPFGSALKLAEQQDDLFVTTSETHHFRRVRHRRELVLRPAHFLLVLDWLYDRTGQDHDFRQWFQLGPQWRVLESVDGALFASASQRTLWVANLLDPAAAPECHRGETEPQLSGWRSDRAESLVPTTSMRFTDRGHRGAFATLFLFGKGATTTGTRANQTMNAGRYRWREGDEIKTVTMSREDSAARATFRSSYEEAPVSATSLAADQQPRNEDL